jgi:hypothetical protein
MRKQFQNREIIPANVANEMAVVTPKCHHAIAVPKTNVAVQKGKKMQPNR